MLTIIWVALILALGVSSCRTGLDSKETLVKDLKRSLFKFLPQISTVDDGSFEPEAFPRTREERLALVEKYRTNLSQDSVYLPTLIDSVLGLLINSVFWPLKNASEENRHTFSAKSAKDFVKSVGEALGFTQRPPLDYNEQVANDDEDATHDYASVPLYKMQSIHRRSGLPVELKETTSEFESEEPCRSVCSKQMGSTHGNPGEHFPDYEDIPITSFSCTDKRIPGIYADLETGCQVFHVCHPDRTESFLCPIGTIFNQETLACDFWCNFNCSLAPLFFKTESLSPKQDTSSISSTTEDLHTTFQAERITTTQVPPTLETEDPSGETTDYTTSRPTTSEFDSDYTTSRPTTFEFTSDYTTSQPTTSESTPTDRKKCLTSKVWSSIKFNPIKSRIAIYADSVKPTEDPESSRRKRSKAVESKKRKMAVASSILRAILKATENIARNARSFILEIEEAKRQVKDPVKVVRPNVEAVPPVTLDDLPQFRPKSMPKINPRFVVRPVFVGTQSVKAKSKLEKIKQFKKPSVSSKTNVPEMVLKSLEFVGSVLNDDILPLTRRILIESHTKLAKSKH